MGGNESDNQPRFEIEIPSLYISKSPLTNEEYEAFDPEHARGETSSGDDSPVVNISWENAVAYCRWYSEASGKSFRLPNEAEWEFACRGNGQPAEREMWDRERSEGKCHSIESLPANGFGLYDTLGNVWEWTSSLYQAYPITNDDGRDDLELTGPRVIRGGSFRTPTGEINAATRASLEGSESRDDISFRIVRLL